MLILMMPAAVLPIEAFRKFVSSCAWAMESEWHVVVVDDSGGIPSKWRAIMWAALRAFRAPRCWQKIVAHLVIVFNARKSFGYLGNWLKPYKDLQN